MGISGSNLQKKGCVINSTICPYCNSNIKFTGNDGSKVQKSLDDLEKQIKKIMELYTLQTQTFVLILWYRNDTGEYKWKPSHSNN